MKTSKCAIQFKSRLHKDCFFTESVVVLELVTGADRDEVDDLAAEVEDAVLLLALHRRHRVSVAVARARHPSREQHQRLAVRSARAKREQKDQLKMP